LFGKAADDDAAAELSAMSVSDSGAASASLFKPAGERMLDVKVA
jgi:hypothetical protein